jgi:hypothetical protein
MQSRCAKHLFEGAEDFCGKCGLEFCGECLVYAFGPKKPPLCIPCAVQAAGIRASAGNRPSVGKNEMKRMQKERNSAFRRFRRDKSRRAKAEEPAPAPDLWPDPPAPPLPPAEPVEPAMPPAAVIEPEFLPQPAQPAEPAHPYSELPYAEEPFVTEPAYVDPTPSSIRSI